MISTSSHNNWTTDLYQTVSISGNRGKDANYHGRCYPQLAPKLSFWKVWHSNIGVVSLEENNKYYIEEYWKQVLSKLDPEKTYSDLDYNILLCYEDNMEFCHRHIVAAWFELLLDIEVPEVKIINDKIEEVDRPTYIKDYLEEVIKKDKNMRGFKSLRALYLFEKSERLENLANKLEEQTGKSYDDYRQEACYLRCDADMAEDEYREQKRLIRKK